LRTSSAPQRALAIIVEIFGDVKYYMGEEEKHHHRIAGAFALSGEANEF